MGEVESFSPLKNVLGENEWFPTQITVKSTLHTIQQIWEVPAHDTRVLASALSPDGSTIGTAASDENLKVSLLSKICFQL